MTAWWSVIGGLVGGALISGLAWFAMQPVFSHPALARANFRGRSVPTAGGLVLILAALVGEAIFSVLRLAAGWPQATTPSRVAILFVAAGFGLLGFVDDLLGSSDRRGFKGHVSSLLRGRLTSGGLKLVGGASVATVATGLIGSDGIVRLLVDAALVALAANLANLLDLRPGRTLKFSAVGFAALLLTAGATEVLGGPALVLGAGLGVLWPDLREKVMLGDTGANVLGAVLGIAAVLSLSPVGRVWTAGVLLALNLLSEVVSFGRLIDSVPPLRLVDRLGRAS